MKHFVLMLALLEVVVTLPKAWAGQSPARRIDSLTALLKTYPAADTNRVRTLAMLAGSLNSSNPPAAVAKAREALRLAEQLHYPRGEAMASYELAVCAFEGGDLKSAAAYFQRSLTIWQAARSQKKILRAQNGLASVYASQGSFNEALRLFISNLTIAEQLGDRRMQVMSLSNIGSMTKQLLDDQKAIGYYERALTLVDTVAAIHDYEAALCNIAGAYLDLKQYDKAAPYIRRALRVTRLTGDLQNEGTMQLAFGQVEAEKNHWAAAKRFFERALALGRKAEDNYLTLLALNHLGQVAAKQHQSARALSYYQQALPLALRNGAHYNTADSYGGLASAYAAVRQFDKAFENQQASSRYADSAKAEKAVSETRILQTKFETERKEAQNRLLTKQQQLQAARLREQQQVIRRRTTLLVAGALVTALLAGLAYLLVARRRLRREVEFAQEREQLQHLRVAAVLEAEEAERRRIGSDLHDGVGQLLTAAKMNLYALGEELPRPTVGQQALFQNALDIVDESFREVRSISHNLMPNALIKRGLAQAVRDFLDKIAPDGRLKIQLEVVGLDQGPRLGATVENVLFRVIQELVQNIIKHAQATQVTLQILRNAEELTVMVEDNGVGFDPATLGQEAGIGLKNIESRMAYLGGRADFDTAPGRGTTVTLEVPLGE